MRHWQARLLLLSLCAAQTGCPVDSPASRRRVRESVLLQGQIASVQARLKIDPRTTLCVLMADRENVDSPVILGGLAENAAQIRAVVAQIIAAGFPKVENRTVDVSDRRYRSNDFARVVASHVPLVALDSRLRYGPVTEVVNGESLWVMLDGTRVIPYGDDPPDASRLLVRASDGYIGWIRRDAIEFVDRPHFVGLLNAMPPAHERVDAIIAEARTFLGTPYLWGGKTTDGIDCSGLMQVCFARHGVLLPRDADQQCGVGRLVATRECREALRAGDLLFFVSPERGNVSHAALYLGANQFIQAASGREGVRISSLDPADANYDREHGKNFAWGRRVID